MTKIRAIQDHVIFQFVQDIERVSCGKSNSTAFTENTDWGFKFKNFDESTEQPRWGVIISTGPRVSSSLTPGLTILIAPLKWTDGVAFEGAKYWRTDENSVLAIHED